MVTFISFLLAALAVLFAVIVAIFFIEVIAAIILPGRHFSGFPAQAPRGRIAVLVPAHNESTGILPTIADVKSQISAGDRLLVVADNCSDDTAAVAAQAGAEVTSRNEPDKRGKGYALAWGVRHLELDPPDIVIIVDADCRLHDSAISRLAATCTATNKPVQSLFTVIMQGDSPLDTRVSEFAWRVKNYVRPLGLSNLGLPCQLMGSGMAFPWALIRTAKLASDSIVEDLDLGLELAEAGYSPVFSPFPGVISSFPFTVAGLQSQRLRWEQGHISAILRMVPRLIFVATTKANLGLLALALDLIVPPLAFLGVLLVGVSAITGLAAWLGASSAPMSVSLASLVVYVGTLFVCWLKYGREILPSFSILLIFSYVLGKTPLYRKILSSRAGSKWVRTDRAKS